MTDSQVQQFARRNVGGGGKAAKNSKQLLQKDTDREC
jgi:hypothetical protein